MRFIISFLLALMLTGCTSSSCSTFVTTFGSHTFLGGMWRITASEGSLAIAPPATSHRGDWITHSPANWKAQTGWFVYIEITTSVWAYDGGRRLVLEELTGVEDYSAMSEMLFQRKIPAAVYSKLSENTKGMIDFLKKRTNTALEPTRSGAISSTSRSTSPPTGGSVFVC